VSGPIADNAKSEVPAQVETTDVVVEAPAVEAEAPVAEAVVTEEVVAEVAVEATDAAETPAE
jgi:large subunit ribosomal protein L10